MPSLVGHRKIGPCCIAMIMSVLGCGSRSPLPVDDPESCREAGATRMCENTCGAGLQTCVDERWQPCEVPVDTRTCSNDCGEGLQTCASGSWGACYVPIATRTCSSLCGQGTEVCIDGLWQNCDAPRPALPKLKATVRDFLDTHPDFEHEKGRDQLDLKIVAPELGPDDKPVYAGNPTTVSTNGKSFFDQWFRDAPRVNLTTILFIPLTSSTARPDIFTYESGAFFPIDNQLFGNQGRTHNFHFTLELAAKFRYQGGESFTFGGDDDLWAFINRKLAINLGGLHSSMSSTVDLASRRQELGLTAGGVYPLHLFFAERHTSGSTFHVQTTIAEFDACE